jgi:hypothetical protein
MRFRIVAALALSATTSLQAQTTAPTAPVAAPAVTAPPIDLSTASPIDGTWVYSVGSSSEATFVSASAQPQVTIHCSVAVRQVTISKPAGAAAPFLNVWTSTQTRNLAATYNAATARISGVVNAYDPLLDAIAFSRGRIAFSVSGQPPLVVPAWADIARVVEDCRA